MCAGPGCSCRLGLLRLPGLSCSNGNQERSIGISCYRFGFLRLVLPVFASCILKICCEVLNRLGLWCSLDQGHLGASVGWASDFGQVMISQFLSSSPALSSVLTVQSLEPASDSVSPSPSAPCLAHTLSLSLKKWINANKQKKNC